MLKALRGSKVLIAATALTASVAIVAGSLAWFTASASSAGTINVGTLGVTQAFAIDNPNDVYQPGDDVTGAQRIANTGSIAGAMIQVRITDPKVIAADGKTELDGSVVAPNPAGNGPAALYSPVGWTVGGSEKNFMWWIDPADPGVYYVTVDGALDDNGKLIAGGIPVDFNFDYNLNGPRMGNEYQGCKVSATGTVFATQIYEGAMNDPSIWGANRPIQTWGVSIAGSSAPNVHNLIPAANVRRSMDPHVAELAAYFQAMAK